MAAPALRYAVPWREVAGLWRPIITHQRCDLRAFTASVVARMAPGPLAFGLEDLPASPRFLVVANHFQRPGMWILHPASAISDVLAGHYTSLQPPTRWIVTANWPRWRLGPIQVPSPGDILLPRVAHALWCYAVPFAGTHPRRTARAFRELLRDASQGSVPLGVFPEGVAGTAGRVGEPLPGVERLITLLAKAGYPVIPVGIAEEGRLILRFGRAIPPGDLLTAGNSAALALEQVRRLV